jgi:hypothetical protein
MPPRKAVVAFLVAGALGVHALLVAWGAHVNSPTLNEPGHLVAGVGNWRFGRFDLYCVNPPLVRMVAAAPVLLARPNTDWHGFYEGPSARPEFSLGEDFVAANGERSARLFALARWACMPFSLLGGYLCYRWAKQLEGQAAGFFAISLWCFCPDLLGHGALITPDVPATALGLAASYSFWLWLKKPTWARALTSGVILGLAELTKMTLVILFPLWFAMWLVYRWPDRNAHRAKNWFREFGMLAAGVLVAIYILNLGYGFQAGFTRLGDYRFVSAALGAEGASEQASDGGGNRFADSLLGKLPVPLPKHYLLGMDLQRRDFEDYHSPSYLAGQFQERGWWYYYFYALAIKVPLGTWLLVVLAAFGPAFCRRVGTEPTDTNAPRSHHGSGPVAAWRDEFALLCPAVTVLVFVSSQTRFSEHMRYVLPIFPFFFIWIGRLGPLLGGQHRVLTAIAMVSLLWSIGSSLAVYPHSLSYFNELVGGPMGGPNHLIHSNVDWGQDLFFLKDWIREHPEAKPLKLVYFGYCDPIYFGVEYSAPESPVAASDASGPQIAPGWYAISVNFVRGLPYFSYKGDGTKVSYGQNAFVPFQKLKPVATAGYSIYIYHVE